MIIIYYIFFYGLRINENNNNWWYIFDIGNGYLKVLRLSYRDILYIVFLDDGM